MNTNVRTGITLLITTLSLFSCGKQKDANENAINNPHLNETMPKGNTYSVGDYVYGDYSFLDFNKKDHSLQDALKAKQLVVINLWATWCGPCKNEFPIVQEAYDKYSKNVEFFALSDDLNTTIKDWYTSNSLTYTFPMGKDTGLKMINAFQLSAYPTSAFIDRDGKIDLIVVGGLECWENIFEYYTSDAYESGKAKIVAGEFVVTE